MEHDYRYISKHDPKVRAAYEDLLRLLNEVRKELRDFTFQHRIVGSYSRNMITYDEKGNTGYDFDVNIYPNDEDETFAPKQIRLKLKEAFDRCCKAHGYAPAEDSTRVLTIKVKDRQRSRIEHSVDFAIVNDYIDEDGEERQEYIRFNKNQQSYTWEQQPEGYYMLPKKVAWCKTDNAVWKQVRELYIEKKNANTDRHVHSRTILAITVHEVCQKNGYYESEDE